MGINNDLDVGSVDNNSDGNVFVTDCKGDKIHILNGFEKFLKYFDLQCIKNPCTVCIVPGGDIIVGKKRDRYRKNIRIFRMEMCRTVTC